MRGLKIKTARLGWLFAMACGPAWGWAAGAHAQPAPDPRVLVFEPKAAPSGFLATLQIQLVGLAEPEVVSRSPAGSTAEQIEAAGALARERQALAALWVERATQRSDGSRQVILYVVGEREGRALIEVVRVPRSRGPELNRTLALKVREIVGELRRSRAKAPPEALLLPPEAAPPAPGDPTARPGGEIAEGGEAENAEDPDGDDVDVPEAGHAPPRVGGFAQLSLRLGSQPRVGLGRWGVGFAAGPSLALAESRFAATVGLDWFPETSIEWNGQRALYWELTGAIALHAQLRAGALWLGAQTGPQLLWLHGTDDLTGGQRTVSAWAWNAGLSAELPLGAALGVAAELQLQSLLQRRGFTVNGQRLIDVGRARVRLGLAVSFRP